MKILILCTGNSCRSQMAEGILKSLNTSFEVYSAGIRPEKEVNPYAIRVMKETGIDISSHYPKHVNQFTGQEFDYVITVCDNARETCPIFTGTVRNRLHVGFEDPADARGSDEEIMEVYRNTRDLIMTEFRKLAVKMATGLN